MKKIILFGCGANSKLAYDKLSKKYKILFFSDNNTEIQGNRVNGVEILCPTMLKDIEFDLVFIPSMYFAEISEQLLEIGINKNKIKIFKKRDNKKILLSLIYPLYGFIPNIVRMLLTIYKSKVLICQKLSNYNRYTAAHGINSLFYWTQALNFKRFGRNGISSVVGTGNYHLGNWWFSSLPSLYLYKKLGAMMPVLCMFFWFLLHLLWLGYDDIETFWAISILIIIFFSSYFFGGCFVFLNYNALGWMFMPLGLFGLITENFWIAAFAWGATSFASITVLFIAFWISFAYGLYDFSPYPLISLIPSLLILSINLLYTNDIKSAITKTAKAIGINNSRNRKTNYKRSKSTGFKNIRFLYFFTVWFTYASFLWLNDAFALSIMCGTVLILAVLNASILRFADDQSIYLAMFSIASISMIQIQSLPLLLVFWFGAFSWPNNIGAESRKGSDACPQWLEPFCISNLVNKAKDFLSDLPTDAKVLCVFKDPKATYEKIFDGYRTIYELLFFAGTLKGVLVFPNWWAIFENNSIDSPGFWGREPEDAVANLKLWDADHVLIYQHADTPLEMKWKQKGFIELAQLDWNSLLKNDLKEESCWGSLPSPKWFLLKYNETNPKTAEHTK